VSGSSLSVNMQVILTTLLKFKRKFERKQNKRTLFLCVYPFLKSALVFQNSTLYFNRNLFSLTNFVTTKYKQNCKSKFLGFLLLNKSKASPLRLGKRTFSFKTSFKREYSKKLFGGLLKLRNVFLRRFKRCINLKNLLKRFAIFPKL